MKTVHSSPSLSPSGTKRQKANLFTNENPEAIAQMRMQSAQKEQHKVMVRLDNRTHVLVAPQNVTPEYIEMLRKKYKLPTMLQLEEEEGNIEDRISTYN
ncbi:hypothetical protein NXV84_19440 [Bacteroides fragilis]|nr:hypothetical protein [Bacteroides fragilis]